jgi:esterase
MQLHLVSRGSPQHPCVVCIHGLLGSSRTLHRLVETIAEKGYFVLAYDQRGHGHSAHSDDYTVRSLAGDVFTILDQNKIQSAHLVGHSLGARVALASTAIQPARILSLTMLDAGAKISTRAIQNVRDIIEPLPESFRTREEASDFLNRYNAAMKMFLLSNIRQKNDVFTWNFDLSGIRQKLLGDLRGEDLIEPWRNLKCPAFLLRGENSDHFTQEEFEEMLELNPRAEGNVIANAGHWLHVDNFNDTTQEILRFLGKGTRH